MTANKNVILSEAKNLSSLFSLLTEGIIYVTFLIVLVR